MPPRLQKRPTDHPYFATLMDEADTIVAGIRKLAEAGKQERDAQVGGSRPGL